MNQNKRNYQKELEKIIEKKTDRPKLLLHACCAPCSSYCLEYLREYFDITVFFYNPNISEATEYQKRIEEEKRLIASYNEQVLHQSFEGMNSSEQAGLIQIIESEYVPAEFYQAVKGLEQCKEGGERCFTCFELRLRKSFEVAKEGDFDYVTTTLTISPLKNADKLNEIGERLAGELQVPWLPSDFKKKNGYKRSIELSHMYDLYRQDYCGCIYSKLEREKTKQESNQIKIEW